MCCLFKELYRGYYKCRSEVNFHMCKIDIYAKLSEFLVKGIASSLSMMSRVAAGAAVVQHLPQNLI